MYVFDTDHISLYGRDFPEIVERVAFTQTPLITTFVTVEEQIRGRMKQLVETKTDSHRSQVYEWLTQTIRFLNAFEAPHEKPKKKKLTDEQRGENKVLSGKRIFIEQFVGYLD